MNRQTKVLIDTLEEAAEAGMTFPGLQELVPEGVQEYFLRFIGQTDYVSPELEGDLEKTYLTEVDWEAVAARIKELWVANE